MEVGFGRGLQMWSRQYPQGAVTSRKNVLFAIVASRKADASVFFFTSLHATPSFGSA